MCSIWCEWGVSPGAKLETPDQPIALGVLEVYERELSTGYKVLTHVT